jgi:UDPglucose 6-dehydrogenase
MNICVVGTGYVGLVSGACLAQLGHTVTCVDVDEAKIKKLQQGIIPIYEPGLEEIVKKNYQNKNLIFTTSLKEGLQEAEVVLNAVGTPPDEQRKVDLRYVYAVAQQVGELLDHYVVFVNKSTVPVGTADTVKTLIAENIKKGIPFDVASNPEFLREGAAIDDFLHPDRIIVGVETKKAQQTLTSMYQSLITQGAEFMVTDIRSAELIKYASNSFLATKISYINEIAQLCERIGANVLEVAQGMGLDSRIGKKFLEPGPGFGGSCFPKDVDGLIHTGLDYGMQLRILESVMDVNREQQLLAVNKVRQQLESLVGKTIAIWGLAFKPETDDIRESSAIVVIQKLIQEGAIVHCYDPIANENTKKVISGKTISYFDEKFDALDKADALILMTHWNEFKAIQPATIKEKMNGTIVIDTRNIWNKKEFQAAGLEYEGIGV